MALCDYLHLKRYFFWRQNVAPIFNRINNCYQAMPKYSKKGVSDIILVKEGVIYFLEVKRPGGVQSDAQKEFQADAEKAGAKYKLCTGIDDLLALGL